MEKTCLPSQRLEEPAKADVPTGGGKLTGNQSCANITQSKSGSRLQDPVQTLPLQPCQGCLAPTPSAALAQLICTMELLAIGRACQALQNPTLCQLIY